MDKFADWANGHIREVARITTDGKVIIRDYSLTLLMLDELITEHYGECQQGERLLLKVCRALVKELQRLTSEQELEL